MQSVIEIFKNGSAREKLALLSDIFSIVGVSFAALLAPMITANNEINADKIFGVSYLCLLGLIGEVVLLIFTIFLVQIINSIFNTNNEIRKLFTLLIWLAFLLISITLLWFIYSIIIGTHW